MKVSVIIPTYNEEGDIEKCLETLAHQTFKDMEIIVVDDGSSDDTAQKLQNSKTQKLKILKQTHKGAGAARNYGAKRAAGDILVFVDADMYFSKDFIGDLVRPIIERKAVGTFSKNENLANQDNVWARCWNINRGFEETSMHPMNYPDTQKVFRAILRREFDRAGGFNEKAGYNDDWSVSEKLGTLAASVPGAIFWHKNPDSLSEVFVQSKWMAKRKYKLGAVGFLAALARVSLPVSFAAGIIKSIEIFNFQFLIFKLVSDFGQFIGILEYTLLKKVSR